MLYESQIFSAKTDFESKSKRTYFIIDIKTVASHRYTKTEEKEKFTQKRVINLLL